MENLKNVAPIEDFNWDAYENGEAVTNASHEELEKAYDGTLNKVNDREVVDGTVIAMNKREVVVNIGYKSDGIIPMSEFRYNPELKVGDTVEVYIENQEDKKGQLVLSHRKARATRSWDRVNAALENEEIIKESRKRMRVWDSAMTFSTKLSNKSSSKMFICSGPFFMTSVILRMASMVSSKASFSDNQRRSPRS